MTWSLGEFEALATKAARGAGFDWDRAAAAGHAARALQAAGLDGAAALVRLLEAGCEAASCPVLTGLAALEAPPALPARWPGIRVPVLSLPFLTPLGRAALDGAQAARDDKQGAWYSVATLRLDPGPTPLVLRATRVPEAAAPSIRVLRGLAEKTYAPATEASRRTGAGEG